MNSVSNNPYRGININMENNNISNNEQSKINKIDNLESPIVENFLNKIKEEIENAQLICIKIVKGESVSKEELEFITKKYPDMKQIADESFRDYNKITKELKLCKTHEEREQLLSKFIKEISDSIKSGYISEPQSKIKNTLIEQIIKFSENIKENIKLELEKAEGIALKIVKGEKITITQEQFLKQKYPNIKQVTQETVKYINNLKLDLKSCKTQQEREQLLFKEVKNLESQKCILSKTEIKLKMSGIEQIEKFLNNNKKDMDKLQLITLKVIKNKSLTKSEEKFISEKYLDIKEVIRNEIREYEYLKDLPKDYKNKEEIIKEEIISKELKEIEYQIEANRISENQAIIKKVIIEDIKKESQEGINYYMSIYLHMLFNTITENNLAIIIVVFIIISLMYIF